jgi:hypothetical protein
MKQEAFLENLADVLGEKNPELEPLFRRHAKFQKTLTRFLRSGRLISIK